MTNLMRGRDGIHGMRALGAALALAIMLAAMIAAQPAQAQTFKLLYAFKGGPDGAFPSSLVQDAAGNLYGMAFFGGDLACAPPFGCGTVFKVDTSGNFSVLHTFTGTSDGALPSSFSRMVLDSAGNLYGNTGAGGKDGSGTVFKLDTTGTETVLYSFTGGTDGLSPQGGLIRDGLGNLYGTTDFGGDLSCSNGSGCGTVFKVDPHGNETVLYAFTGTPDGRQPNGRLVRDPAGNLYGTNVFDGATCPDPSGCGTVFEVDTTSHETVLYTFTGGADGGNPEAGLIRDGAGTLFGTADFGAHTNGVVFKLDTTGTETVLYAFTGGADGGSPRGALVADSRHNLYGTTTYGGNLACAFGCGTVFKVDPLGNETVLYSFTGGNDGANPISTLYRDSSGNLYGTTTSGGDLTCNSGSGCGTVFKITP